MGEEESWNPLGVGWPPPNSCDTVAVVMPPVATPLNVIVTSDTPAGVTSTFVPTGVTPASAILTSGTVASPGDVGPLAMTFTRVQAGSSMISAGSVTRLGAEVVL